MNSDPISFDEAASREPSFEFASVPWYPDSWSYEQFRVDAIDADSFFATYQEWLSVALAHEQHAQRVGVTIIRIRMSKDAFEQWCQVTDARNDAVSRSAYAEDRACRIL